MPKRLLFLSCLSISLCGTGCDVPYKEEYEKAMELKAQAEELKVQAEQKAAEAQQMAAEAQDALTAEQHAIERLYTEDQSESVDQ